ncbi:dihydrolipoamide acetyltransferase family protein [Kibdelosporangium philippinense]
MATLLRVPEVATGSTSALLTEWLVAENARFAAGDPLVVLETDKAAVEVEAEVDAVLLRALVPGGTNVEAGSPIALLGSEAEAADVDRLLVELGVGTGSEAAVESGPELAATSPEPVQRPRVFASPLARKLLKEAGMTPDQVTGTGPDGRIVRRDVDKAIELKSMALNSTDPNLAAANLVAPSSVARNSVEASSIESQSVGPNSGGLNPAGLNPVGSDSAGLDSAGLNSAGLDSAGLDSAGLNSAGLDSVGLDSAGQDRVGRESSGSDRVGHDLAGSERVGSDRVGREPVVGKHLPPQLPPAQGEEVPLTRMRRAIARRLTESKRDIPHFYLRRTARIDALLALRKQLNEVSPEKISVNDLVVRAVGVAHTQVPDANVIWTGDGMTRYSTVDVGVAVASSRGLLTPVLRGVERSSPSAISRQIKEFARQADGGKLRQSDLEGGTITVSNLGMYGVEEFSAIINPPQSMILAVGAGRQAPVVVDGEVRVETQMALTLSVDHRAIDGALAAQWMAALITALEEPLRLLA